MIIWLLSLTLSHSAFSMSKALPKPPTDSTFSSVENLGTEFDLYDVRYRAGRESHDGTPARPKNLLFVAADSFIQEQFRGALGEMYPQQPDIRIETLVWWRFAPYFEYLYEEVYFINFEGSRYKNIERALLELQAKGQDFDVIMLTHGVPGRLSDGDRGFFLSFRELAKFKDQLSHLNMVFLQSCYGQSLAEDWLAAGAKTVYAYDGLNRNFLFIDLFMRYYRWFPNDSERAYRHANVNFEFYLGQKLFYIGLLKALKVTPEQYMEISPSPLVTRRK